MKQSSQYVDTVFLKFLVVLVVVVVVVPCSCIDEYYELCATRRCSYGPNISYPFRLSTPNNSYCGYPGFELSCSRFGYPLLRLNDQDYVVENISYETNTTRLYNAAFFNMKSGCFPEIKNYSLELSDVGLREFKSFSDLYILSDCNMAAEGMGRDMERYEIGCNNGKSGLVMFGGDENLQKALEECNIDVIAPVEDGGWDKDKVKDEYEDAMRRGFELGWIVSECTECKASGGRCGFNNTSKHFRCFCTDRPHSSSCKPNKSKKLGVILGSVLGGIVFILVIVCIFIIWLRKRRNKDGTYTFSRDLYSGPSSKADVEVGSVRFGVPVYTYAELEKATASFDSANELGDGGFGIVYFGKLQDGREVAVKRLYEHNYKRMEHFMNEINILTSLRHPNLVSLYGCTSRRSRELLLVYEYVPNGTVADHIHGNRAEERLLTWPIRMNIAVETANALAYLHNSEIIHRDVKTNNILLDQNFSVKVADFGLSRLFPLDATHVSTAPQGTPGYVDPEYHECYQLTVKSDVYSFGVVLIELISSLPAVDITRHRHEINLSNLAMSRIQRNALDELVDPSLGYGSDPDVRRMISSIAELAYRCLQVEKEMRPSMDEVLEILQAINEGANDSEPKEASEVNDEFGIEKGVVVPPSPESDEIVLLKNMKLTASPISVTERWISGSSSASV